MSAPVRIPIRPAPPSGDGDAAPSDCSGVAPSGCSGAEPFALMVLGDAMAPEFIAGEIIVVEPEGHATDGSFVVAQVGGEWTLRQLVRQGTRWQLRALDTAYPAHELADFASVRGVVIQKSKPGRRRASKRYVD